MSDAISAVVQKQVNSGMPGMEKQPSQQTPAGSSFENILQNGGRQTPETTNNSSVPNITDDKKINAMRLDLINRYNNLPNGMPSTTAILPEFLDMKTSMSGMKKILSDAMNSGISNNQTQGVIGKFTGIEKESSDLNAIMNSGKNLSQGELLGLQARLYQVSQHIDVLSKVVDQMTGGVKTILNTNV
ncbi:MAG: hypothetical protein M3T96_09440 [Acidobacteriota bacterium]|nr:hypothetical protein [Acidobacteriota bacterium]